MALTAPILSTPRAGASPRLLHVTDVLPFTGDRTSPAMIAAITRGRAVHKLTEDHDLGVELLTVEPAYAGYLAAWQQCLAQTGATVKEVECAVGGEHIGYVGRLDRIVTIGPALWIWDIKTGPPWPTHGPQTAAYEHAYRDKADLPKKSKVYRACVHLRSDGTYQLKPHTSVHDLNTFLAYLRIARWEIENGLRQPPAERDDQ